MTNPRSDKSQKRQILEASNPESDKSQKRQILEATYPRSIKSQKATNLRSDKSQKYQIPEGDKSQKRQILVLSNPRGRQIQEVTESLNHKLRTTLIIRHEADYISMTPICTQYSKGIRHKVGLGIRSLVFSSELLIFCERKSKIVIRSFPKSKSIFCSF